MANGDIRFRLFVEPQEGVDYQTVLSFATEGERLGFDAMLISDHLLHMGAGDGGVGPLEAWTTLAALARDTSTIRLGTLVSSVTFRHPAMLAFQVATVDELSNGRAELGLGTGWFESEHRGYGIPFPRNRFEILEEQLEVITGLWYSNGSFDHEGAHYKLEGAPALRKPVQDRLPIIIGGSGPRRTPMLAARFADEYNAVFEPDPAPAIARVRTACERIGRDPDSLRYSLARVSILGQTEAEHRRRLEALDDDPRLQDALALPPTPAQAVDEIGRFVEAGVDTVYLQVMNFGDVEQLEFLAAEILPAFSRR
ncbi:TIGR03560 family F420-dependent LLM class oxidoreductase [Mycolicibacterium litorale]|uniref:TIGR03560 family F420-dependent LLM class oxidoreductase n=1 Tax=Mycolicibacterium litorale TaxID=758802 RepID=UPI003CF5959E